MIRIEILGPFRVLGPTGDVVVIPRGKLTGLLAYLATELQGIERDALEALFWPDTSSLRARRQSLRQALYALRKLLGADPFVMGDRIRLDEEGSSSDYLDLQEALWEDDVEAGLALLRGIPFTDVPSDISVEFEHWIERRRADLQQRLASTIESHGRGALEEGEEDTVRRVLRSGVRAGLSEDALRTAIYRKHAADPSWASASAGSSGIERLILRARPAAPFVVGLVVEEEAGWAEEVASRAMDGLPTEGRPQFVRLSGSANPASEVATMLEFLVGLPGGAAVRKGTIQLIGELRDAESRHDVEDRRVEIESALADALDAVLHEQALVLTVEAGELRLLTSSLLAHAVGLQGGEGLTLLIEGGEEEEFSSLPVRSLVLPAKELVLVRQTDGPTMPAATLSSHAEAPNIPDSAPIRHTAVAVLALLGMIAVGATVMSSASSRPLSTYDVLFCSSRSGVPQYYRWSAATRAVERFTGDTAAHLVREESPRCRADLIASGNGTVRLAIHTDSGIGWSTYPAEWSRADVDRLDTLLLFSADPRQAAFSLGYDRVLRLAEDNGWEVASFDGTPSVATPLRRNDIPDSWSDPWLVFRRLAQSGHQDLFRLNVETLAVEQLTDDPMDEAWGTLRGDSMLFARGRLGDAEDGSLELVLRDIVTDVETQLTDNTWNDYEVRWSASGRHICWQSEELGHYQSDIMVMDLRSRRAWNLSDSEGREHDCRFTPDGRAVVYRSLSTGDGDLMIQAVEGGDPLNLTLFAGSDVLVGFLPGGGS